MNGFQILALTLLVLLVLVTIEAAARGGIRKRIATLWLVVWTIAGVAIAWPRSTGLIASALGIGRGADLILYSTVVVTMVGFFYVYTRFRRLDRQLTLLVRRLATTNAQPPLTGTGEQAPAPRP
jgi:hypothetical protein